MEATGGGQRAAEQVDAECLGFDWVVSVQLVYRKYEKAPYIDCIVIQLDHFEGFCILYVVPSEATAAPCWGYPQSAEFQDYVLVPFL